LRRGRKTQARAHRLRRAIKTVKPGTVVDDAVAARHARFHIVTWTCKSGHRPQHQPGKQGNAKFSGRA
jgi:hypothetical protein